MNTSDKPSIIYVGSNPSQASRTILPFCGDTKSDAILRNWMRTVDLSDEYESCYCNVLDVKTENNKPLTNDEIKRALPNLRSKIRNHDVIVALGKTAAKALTLLGVEFFELPHPSPRNRLLNDPQLIKNKLEALREYCLNTKMPQPSTKLD